jgi:hypothetical protein
MGNKSWQPKKLPHVVAGNRLPCTRHSDIDYAMNNLTGKTAVPFSLHDSINHIHSLDDYRGSWLLMVFHRHLG